MAAYIHTRADSVLPASASFWVDNIPGLPQLNASSATPKLHTYAGYLPARSPTAANNANAHLYFVLQRAQHIASRRRLIIWFNGGPGCSSFDGLMMEVGPWKCRMDKEGELEWAPPGAAWNEYADVIYLDQPVGTGFSYTDSNGYVTSLSQGAQEVVFFLQQLVKIFPEYAHGNGVTAYLAGESFAGQYIPYTAKAIMDARPSPPIDLNGVVIGNGFIDPRSQSGSELEMMVQAGIWKTSSKEYEQVNSVVQRCKTALDRLQKDYLPRVVPECEHVLPSIIQHTTTRGDKPMCINIYDVRLSDTSPECGMNWPPTLASMYAYLKRQDVRHALHVDEKNKPQAWIECNSRVGSALHGTTIDKVAGRKEEASVKLLPGLLERGLRVLMFAGDKDLICNHIGVQRIGENLVWGGVKGFGTPPPAPLEWYVNNTYAGQWTTARNYTYVRVAGASHMVGYDLPIAAHDMMLRFMGFDDGLGTAELVASAGAAARIPSVLKGSGGAGRKLAFVGGGGAAAGVGMGKGDVGTLPMIPGVDGKTEDQVAEEARWAAYYNAGSAALVFIIIAVCIGTCVLLRSRKRARQLYAKNAPTYGDFVLGGGDDDEEEDDGDARGPSSSAHELTRLVTDQEEADDAQARAGGKKRYFEDEEADEREDAERRAQHDVATAAAVGDQARSGGRRTPSKVRFTDEVPEVWDPASGSGSAGGASAPLAGASGKARDVDSVGRRDEENIFDVGDDEED
ncbi:hypothetical protein CF319_g7177 [Tilletia indica]|nr:hypothetical protein CF319_g7177 [Tilletia indica]